MKKNSIAVPGLKKDNIIEPPIVPVDESGNVVNPPDDLFVQDNPEEETPVVGIGAGKPIDPMNDNSKMVIKIPDYRPYLNSGRLVCQPFTRKRATTGGIIFANEPATERIPKNTTCIVVRKDDAVKGIELFDEVVFADDFKPCEKQLQFADTMVTYYVPHFMDVILIKRAGEPITISERLKQKINML